MKISATVLSSKVEINTIKKNGTGVIRSYTDLRPTNTIRLIPAENSDDIEPITVSVTSVSGKNEYVVAIERTTQDDSNSI